MKTPPSNPTNEPKEDFWDLGDDDLNLDEPSGEGTEEQIPAPATVDQAPSAPTKMEASDLLGELDEDDLAPAPEPAARRVRSESSQNGPRPTSMVEKILLIVSLACLAGIAVWGTKTFYDSAPNGTLAEYKADYPAIGENVTIAGIETWWREPVRTGDNADVGVIMDSNLIPCAKITLSESGSTTIQVSFRDGDDRLIGDTKNLEVNNGKFTRNDSNEINIHATAGFPDPSLINAYANGDIAAWTIKIVEGSKTDTPLVKAPIQANRKEKE